jgi:hypothetical protein
MPNKRRGYRIKFKSLYTHTVEVECDDLRDFICTVARGLDTEAKSFESEIGRITEGMDDGLANEIAQQWADDAFGIFDRYPKLLWQSVFISLYAFFEEQMTSICRRVRKVAKAKNLCSSNVAVPSDSLPAQECLTRFRVRLAVKSAAWRRLLAYKSIRNIVAHNHGNVRSDNNGMKAKSFARRHANIKIERDRITLNSEFCLTVVDDMQSILTKTIKAIPTTLFEWDPPISVVRKA